MLALDGLKLNFRCLLVHCNPCLQILKMLANHWMIKTQ